MLKSVFSKYLLAFLLIITVSFFVLAGVICDRSRRAGAICTVAALGLPFMMLALSGQAVSAFFCWSLDYLFYGFFSVFRVALLMDVAARKRRW